MTFMISKNALLRKTFSPGSFSERHLGAIKDQEQQREDKSRAVGGLESLR